jgi:hypothetical protein
MNLERVTLGDFPLNTIVQYIPSFFSSFLSTRINSLGYPRSHRDPHTDESGVKTWGGEEFPHVTQPMNGR